MNIPKLDKAIIEEYKKLDSTSISDAMDKIGIPSGLYGIKPITPGTVMCGQAFTVRYVPCGEVKGTVGSRDRYACWITAAGTTARSGEISWQ